MNGTAAAASESICATVFPPLMLVRSASVTWRGHGEIQALHHVDKSAAIPLLQPRIVGEFLRNAGVRAAFVLVRGEYLQCRIEHEHAWNRLSCKAPASPLGKSVRPVAPISSVSPVKMRSSTRQAHGIVGVPGGIHRLQAQIARPPTNRRLRGADRQKGPGCAMHDHRRVELTRELSRRGEMIRVRMRVDEIAEAQAMLAPPRRCSGRSG